jgi:hypothetical protein
MFKEMTEDEWIDKYKPIKNHLDKNSSFDGHMFETYGDEEQYIKTYPNPNCIWTYGDGDDDGTYIWAGWSYVNRIGYFITEVPFQDGDEIQVPIWEPDEEEGEE